MNYQEMLKAYQDRRRSALTDSITTALSYADEVSVSLGLLEDTGLINEILDAVTFGLPFAVIAVTEQGAVILGKKTQKAALQDGSYRMLKTGAGMAAGTAAIAVGLGALPAVPIAVGTRLLLEKYRSQALTAYRVKQRSERLRALARQRGWGWEKENTPAL